MEIQIEDVQPRLDKSGQIKKSDFIEHSIEAKLLDLTDSSNARKTVGGTPKKNKDKEEWKRRKEMKGKVIKHNKQQLTSQSSSQGKQFRTPLLHVKTGQRPGHQVPGGLGQGGGCLQEV